ncbi:MAG TPA: energy transducer TonB [Thermoanaerobaculaceae bacterium]|mgnify:FL=1|nr:energy transducer TonB [Acidobacteriota bacterium]NLH11780.1 TonB C-terminal domain-containing protein [Holophagae bacterium]HPW56891.1 energy transducer TonB [Thermoanaerobaculaceae bacterium]
MIDPVSVELEARAREPLRWRWALGSALVVHAAAALVLLLGGSHRPRALSLPSVQVRIAPGLPAPAKPAAPAARSSASGATSRKATPAPPPPARKAAAIDTTSRSIRATPRPVSPEPATANRAGAEGRTDGPELGAGPPGTGHGSGGSGGVALGTGTGTEENFPFAYYLNRVLGSLESNWFKPPVPPDTRCRVRCRIDRSGKVIEAGIEEPSAIPAFDRAALRAVYASAPFPPLPLGFAGPSLTLHLEFGP